MLLSPLVLRQTWRLTGDTTWPVRNLLEACLSPNSYRCPSPYFRNKVVSLLVIIAKMQQFLQWRINQINRIHPLRNQRQNLTQAHDLTFVRAGGCINLSPLVFVEWPTNRWAERAEILHSLWGVLCTTFGKKKLTGPGQVAELWRHKTYSLRPVSQGKSCFQPRN